MVCFTPEYAPQSYPPNLCSCSFFLHEAFFSLSNLSLWKFYPFSSLSSSVLCSTGPTLITFLFYLVSSHLDSQGTYVVLLPWRLFSCIHLFCSKKKGKCAKQWGIRDKPQTLTQVVHNCLKKVKISTQMLSIQDDVYWVKYRILEEKQGRKKENQILDQKIWGRLLEANGMSGNLKCVQKITRLGGKGEF